MPDSLSGAERLAASVLRLAVGFSLITGGVLKLWSLASDSMQDTLLWVVVDGSPMAIAVLSAIEIVLGLLVSLRVLERAVGTTLICMLILFSGVIIAGSYLQGGEARPCGCMGALLSGPLGISGSWFSSLHNLALILAIVAITRWRSPLQQRTRRTPVTESAT